MIVRTLCHVILRALDSFQGERAIPTMMVGIVFMKLSPNIRAYDKLVARSMCVVIMGFLVILLAKK